MRRDSALARKHRKRSGNCKVMTHPFITQRDALVCFEEAPGKKNALFVLNKEAVMDYSFRAI